MVILAKHEVARFGRYLVMEGPVLTSDRQEVSLCWVEEPGGAPVTSFTSCAIAVDLACRLAEYDTGPDDEVPEDIADHRRRRMH